MAWGLGGDRLVTGADRTHLAAYAAAARAGGDVQQELRVAKAQVAHDVAAPHARLPCHGTPRLGLWRQAACLGLCRAYRAAPWLRVLASGRTWQHSHGLPRAVRAASPRPVRVATAHLARGKLPRASAPCSAQEAGTRSRPYVQYGGGPGTYVATQPAPARSRGRSACQKQARLWQASTAKAAGLPRLP